MQKPGQGTFCLDLVVSQNDCQEIFAVGICTRSVRFGLTPCSQHASQASRHLIALQATCPSVIHLVKCDRKWLRNRHFGIRVVRPWGWAVKLRSVIILEVGLSKWQKTKCELNCLFWKVWHNTFYELHAELEQGIVRTPT